MAENIGVSHRDQDTAGTKEQARIRNQATGNPKPFPFPSLLSVLYSSLWSSLYSLYTALKKQVAIFDYLYISVSTFIAFSPFKRKELSRSNLRSNLRSNSPSSLVSLYLTPYHLFKNFTPAVTFSLSSMIKFFFVLDDF